MRQFGTCFRFSRNTPNAKTIKAIEDTKNGFSFNLLRDLDCFPFEKEYPLKILFQMADCVQKWEEHFAKCRVSKEVIEYFRNTFESPFLEKILALSKKIEQN